MQISEEIDRQIARLSPISLGEMEEVRLMDRVDTKYVAEVDLLPAMLADLSDDYRVLEVEGVRRAPYATLYFDTSNRDCYLDHHNGRSNRRKYRQRTYLASGSSFFEVKQRTNRGRTIKQRIEIPAISEALDADAEALITACDDTSPDLLPQMWTHFSRIALVDRQLVERASIDLDLQFRAGDRLRNVPGLMIVEVKQQRASRHSPIRQWLRQARVAPMRISKYCVGSAMLDPTLKRNRFKQKLMILESKHQRNAG